MSLRKKLLETIDSAIKLAESAPQNIQTRGALAKLKVSKAGLEASVEEEDKEKKDSKEQKKDTGEKVSKK
tara:strand:- start:531 stop:740 length:210 start_codon:yes stop_codon:yes gene_type:complete